MAARRLRSFLTAVCHLATVCRATDCERVELVGVADRDEQAATERATRKTNAATHFCLMPQ